ncbi:MAG: hypothetical protein DRI57_11610 [Deltaproteobacteria bacterium]|nr:MAG: hypothetical protein DRI57_11610 [Deltaproteobacteria bacterium]
MARMSLTMRNQASHSTTPLSMWSRRSSEPSGRCCRMKTCRKQVWQKLWWNWKCFLRKRWTDWRRKLLANADWPDGEGQGELHEKKASVPSRLPLFLLLLFLSLCCILSCLYFCVPLYLNTRLIPSVGVRDADCEVRRIGLMGADIADLRIGPEKRAAISISAAHIDYSLRGLFRKKIDCIRFSGVELRCGLKDGNFTLRGFDPKDVLAKSDPSPENAASALPLLPISVGRVEIRNASIICEWKEKSFRLPLELEIIPQDESQRVLNSTLRVYPRGQQLVLLSNADLLKKKIHFEFQSDKIDAGRWSDFFSQIPGLLLSGTCDIRGHADLEILPFRMHSFSARCEFHDAGSRYKSLTLQEEKGEPLALEIEGNEKQWQVAASSMVFASPLPIRVSGITCNVKTASDPLEISGSFRAELEKFGGNAEIPAQIIKPIPLNGNFFGNIFKNGAWEFRLNNSPSPNPCKFRIADTDIESKVPQFKVSAKGGQAQSLLKYGITIPQIQVRTPSATAEIASASVSGKGRFRDQLQLDGRLKLSGGAIRSSDFSIKGISSTLPLTWPWKKSNAAGKLSAKTLQWNQVNMGLLAGTVQQDQSGLTFQATHRSPLISGFVAEIYGICHIFSPDGPETEIRFSAHHKSPSDIDLEKLVPAVKGLAIQGKLEADGKLLAKDGGLTCSLNTRLSQATATFKEKDISVRGLQIAFSMPDCLAMRSAPKQGLKFESAAFGGLNFNDGSIAFQLEPGGAFFIEKGHVRWCGGNIHLHSLRISPGNEDYDLILYCDRLNLAMLLEQLGAASADGEGTVNGRIPIRLKNGKISFNDGFLFSTPGDGGTIHVTGAEMLTEGIPKDTPQYTQIELAREALKDYTYEWAKLRLVTQGENLQLKLQFDGKPAKALPFVYKKEIGGFVRVGAESKGSHFQGIRLDVSMGLPLDKILRYQHLFRQ